MSQCYHQAETIADLAQRQAEAKWAIASESRGRLDALTTLTQSEKTIATTGDSWDSDPWLFGVANGILDLRSGKMRPGQPTDLISRHSPVPYVANAPADRWRQFLVEIFNGDSSLISFVQKAAGLSMTGITTEQVWFLCYEKGANGKSSFLSVLAHVFGEYAQTLPFATLSFPERPQNPNDLAALAGVRIVTTVESGEAGRLNEARIKGLAGEDTIRARFLHAEYFDFRPCLKLWLAVNHRPLVRDESLGFWRKVRLVPFVQQFLLNKALKGQPLAESEGILAWGLLRGV
ncbi:MAG: hypothetical protein HYU29_07595 [Chloroflexi bacterium]|nr:hypothetical protein [Chloroflexota bacterium]